MSRQVRLTAGGLFCSLRGMSISQCGDPQVPQSSTAASARPARQPARRRQPPGCLSAPGSYLRRFQAVCKTLRSGTFFAITRRAQLRALLFVNGVQGLKRSQQGARAAAVSRLATSRRAGGGGSTAKAAAAAEPANACQTESSTHLQAWLQIETSHHPVCLPTCLPVATEAMQSRAPGI